MKKTDERLQEVCLIFFLSKLDSLFTTEHSRKKKPVAARYSIIYVNEYDRPFFMHVENVCVQNSFQQRTIENMDMLNWEFRDKIL